MAMINARLLRDDQEDITTGEAIAGMRLNGLGLSDRPRSLTPQFFANTPVGVLLRHGVSAEHGNRCTRGRRRDKACSYGCAMVCSAVALAVCQRAGSELTCTGLDTTSVSLTGADVPATDPQAMAITYGDAQDHRPDLKHAVLAWMVAHDGGVPLMRQSWDGKASDTVVFKARGEALIAPFEASATPRYGIAAAKLDPEAKAPNVADLPCIPRIPEPLTVTPQVIEPTWAGGEGPPLEETVR